MKDEFKGISTNEFTGLESKRHCIVLANGGEFSTGKGVNISIEFN